MDIVNGFVTWRAFGFACLAAIVLGVLSAGAAAVHAQSDAMDQVDTALVVSVDVSNSVNAERYRLQMEGIAQALEDQSVQQAIMSGPNGGILFSMVTWADRPQVALPWMKISSKAEAMAVAAKVRLLPLQGGEFTCLTRMLRMASDKIVPQIPAHALRIVIDVSGDGTDNCNADEPVDTVRDELVASGVTINGLPILLGDGDGAGIGTVVAPPPSGSAGVPPLEAWYTEHVKGGGGSFVLPANGYGDFARAIRQKFVVEISGAEPTGWTPGRRARMDTAFAGR